MKIKVSDIREEGLELSEEIDISDLEMETAEGKLSGPVRVNARFIRQGNDIMVDGNFSLELDLACDRCLVGFKRNMQQDFHFDYNLGKEELLDITDDLRQEIVLDFPLKMLCRENCKGLCPHCGMNLNEGECNCRR